MTAGIEKIRRSQSAATVARICHNCGRAGDSLVLACLAHLANLLSASLFWRGWSEDHVARVVLGHREADSNFGDDAGSVFARRVWRLASTIDPPSPRLRRSRHRRVVCVARGDDRLHCHRRFRKPASVVPIAAGADRGRVCRRRLRLCRLENIQSRCEDHVFDFAGDLIWLFRVRLRARVLQAERRSVARCRIKSKSCDANWCADSRRR